MLVRHSCTTRKIAVSDSLGEAPEIVGEIQVDFDFAAQHEAIHIPAQGGGKPRFIQQRRMQQVRNSPHLGSHFVDQVFAIGQGIRGFGEALDVAAHSREIHV